MGQVREVTESSADYALGENDADLGSISDEAKDAIMSQLDELDKVQSDEFELELKDVQLSNKHKLVYNNPRDPHAHSIGEPSGYRPSHNLRDEEEKEEEELRVFEQSMH